MKRKMQLFLMLSIIFASTGCMKMDISLGINKDKSMNVTMIEAVDMEALSQFGEGAPTGPILDEEQIKELESVSGVSVEEYKEGKLDGFKVSRVFPNIDELSSEDEIESDLSVITDMEELEEDSYVFQVEKGLFKNKYKASFAGMTDEMNSITGGSDVTDLEGVDTSSLISQLDFKFSINLPYSAISNNATSVENDGKTLIWNLMEFKGETVDFEFELYNANFIYITLGTIIGFILILIILVLITLRGNKKRRQKELSETVEANEQFELPSQDINMQQYHQMPQDIMASSTQLNNNTTSLTEMNPNIQDINNDYYNNM